MNFLFDFNRNYASILYRFRIIARFRQKWRILTHPTCICCPYSGDHVRISPSTHGAIVWRYLRDPTFSRFDTI